MKVFSDPVSFEWDRANIDKNYLKHGVTHKEAEQPFLNKPFLLSKDKKHSEKEDRYQALGKTHEGKLLFLSFTLRNNNVRIISARAMSKKEEVL